MSALIIADCNADIQRRSEEIKAEMMRDGTHILKGGGKYTRRDCASIAIPSEHLKHVLETLRGAGYGVKVKGGYWRVSK